MNDNLRTFRAHVANHTPGREDWLRVQAAATAKRAQIYIYDEIGYWGTSARAFAQTLAELDVDDIDLYLNSPGGDAFAGVAIYNALRRHKATVTVTVDGLAASAASIIAMAGDEVVMSRGSELMIHNAWGYARGDAAVMRQMGTLLEKLSGDLAGIYEARAGSGTDWVKAMSAETWYTASEAVAAGLADRTDDDQTDEDAKAVFQSYVKASANRPLPDLAADYEPPLLPTAAVTPEPPAVSEPGQPTGRTDNMSDTLMAGLRDRLGITDAETSEDAILAALDEALNEQAETPEPQAAMPDGVTMIETAVLAELQTAAAEVRSIRDERTAERRAALVEAAITEGRIAPARRDHWLAQLNADEEGAAAVLATLAAGTIPLGELGHSDDVEASDEERLYNRMYNPQKEA